MNRCRHRFRIVIALLAAAASPPVGARRDRPAPSAAWIAASVRLPHRAFTLANGLRLIVHTDHGAPMVAINLSYRVGSVDEPPEESGLAHLFEHLMFSGSENAPGIYFARMKAPGASQVNGGTGYDATVYYETMSRNALDRALYRESARMGWLLGAVDEHALTTQRGVVQNEKRLGGNRPYGAVQYLQAAALYPAGHPYGHPVIGWMADLDAADPGTVRQWFRDHYGPSNAVLVLAGDVDVDTAHRLAQRWFGGIARGTRLPRRASTRSARAGRRHAPGRQRPGPAAAIVTPSPDGCPPAHDPPASAWRTPSPWSHQPRSRLERDRT